MRNRMRLILVLAGFGLICFLVTVARGACPRATELRPCTCTTIDDDGDELAIITCKGLTSEEQVANALRVSRGLEIFALEIEFSELRFLPHNAFEGTTLNMVNIRNSSLLSLTDTDAAFLGLEKSLHFLEIEDCSFVNDWNWSHLRSLVGLMSVKVTNSDLVYVTQTLAHISTLELEGFDFHDNRISGLEEGTFGPFTALQRLYLDGNLISELRRDVFPWPTAKELQVLGLSYNQLSTLPRDLFSEMPRLKSLYLSGNPIYTLDEKTFESIWNHLNFFFFDETALTCDCRLTWVTRIDNKNKFITSKCQGPAHLAGRDLNSLKAKELWC